MENKVTGKSERMLIMYHRMCDGEILNKAEMADLFQVDRRTIQRDIDDMRNSFSNTSMDFGIYPSIVYDRLQKGFRLDYGEQKMSGSQLLAICKILLESRAFTKKEMDELLEKLLRNCVSRDQEKLVKELISNERHHYCELQHHTEIIEWIWDLGNAAKKQQYVSVSYEKMGQKEPVKRILKPVGIIFSEFYFYLIAFIEPEKDGDEEYLSPAIYRIDRFQTYNVLDKHFSIPYAERFEEGEFRKRIQFMFGGELRRIVFEYTGTSLEAVLDRFPTAVILNHVDGKYTIRAEVYGDGYEMWIRSQGETVKIIDSRTI